MRARQIKPGLFENEILANMSPWHRLLFVGLWCYADREGRFEDRPLKVRMALFPLDDVDVPTMLSDLTEAGFLTRYSVDGVNYVQVNNFDRHQAPHKNEQPSRIPPWQCHGTTKAVPRHNHGSAMDALTEDCGLRTDDCGLRTEDTHTAPAFAEAVCAPEPDPAPLIDLPTPEPPGKSDPFGWAEFAAEYPPHRLNRTNRAKTWLRKNCRSQARLDEIMAGLRRWKISDQWSQGIVPNCGNFLQDETWKCPTPPANARPPGRADVHAVNLAAAEAVIENMRATGHRRLI